MHMVSNVEAELEDGLSAIDLFKATFPAGTVSGAPKIRAMEIIDEFEPVKRGIYGGAIGYLSRKVSYCSTINTSFHRLKFINDLHSSYFRST